MSRTMSTASLKSPITVTSLPSRNPDSATAKAHHVGNPPTSFTNPWPSVGTKASLGQIFSLRFGSHPEKNFVPVPQGPDGTRSEELVKIVKPDWGLQKKDKVRATWIGHASFLLELPAVNGATRGVRILLDPVFSERTSPSQWFGPKRYSPTPCTIDELPDIDIVVISHSHYDHLDHATITTLFQKSRGRIHFFAPLGNKAWFTQHILTLPTQVTESDWWDSHTVTIADIGSVTLTCTPSQHTSGRTPFDANQTLWSSWAIEGAGKKIWFSGDTAYQAQNTPSPCPAFRQIGAELGPFDLALVPIGLMTPASFMGAVHATPEQSFVIHREVGSRLSIGMHYGTVRGGLSGQYEDVRDPARRWRAVAEKQGVWNGGGVEGDGGMIDVTREGVGLCHIGETVVV